jgi:hypothetical protein
MQLIPVECSTSCRFAKQKIENAGKSVRAGLSILKNSQCFDSGGAVLDYEFAFFLHP